MRVFRLFGGAFVLATVLSLGLVQFAHAVVTCTGLGDNIITIGGGGVSVACSKYETPGGGDTKFQTPDGTLCSFGNTATDKITCGKPGEESTKKPVSKAQLHDIVNASIAAGQLGTSIEDLAKQIQQIIGGTSLTGTSYLDSAFEDGASNEIGGIKNEVGVDPFEYLLEIAQIDESEAVLKPSEETEDTLVFQIPTLSGAYFLMPKSTSSPSVHPTTTPYKTAVRVSAVTIPYSTASKTSGDDLYTQGPWGHFSAWFKRHFLEFAPLGVAGMLIVLILLFEWLKTWFKVKRQEQI